MTSWCFRHGICLSVVFFWYFFWKTGKENDVAVLRYSCGVSVKWSHLGGQKTGWFKLATHGSHSWMALLQFNEFIHNPCSTAWSWSTDIIWCLIAQRLVQPLGVVEPEIPAIPDMQFSSWRIAFQIQVPMLEAAPQPFDEHVIQRPPSFIHTEALIHVLRAFGGEIAKCCVLNFKRQVAPRLHW